MTVEVQAKEALKCGSDFVYFLRNYCFIEHKESGASIKFDLWPCQVRAVEKFLSCIYLFILKAHQLGLTWLTAAYVLWLSVFRYNFLAAVISGKEDLAIEFLDRVKFIFDRLPAWLKPPVLKRTNLILHFGREERDEFGNLKVVGLNSMIKSLTTTEEGTQSKTPNVLVLDEAALIQFCKKIWAASKPGIDAAHGQIIVISNPVKHAPGWPWFRDMFIRAWKQTARGFEYLFLGWFEHPERAKDFIDLQIEQGMDQDDIAMRYPGTVEEAIEALSGSYFGTALKIHNNFRKPKQGVLDYEQGKEGKEAVFRPLRHGMLHVWEEPDGKGWHNRHVIFSDISEGLERTSSVAYVFDRHRDKFIAKLVSSSIDADQWADELVKLADWCGDKPVVAPERTGAGITTVNKLRRLQYPRVYVHKKAGKTKGAVTREYGWPESKENKRILADALKTYLRDAKVSVPDGTLIDQCSTFIRHIDGTIGKEDDSKFDDHVIAAGGCLAVSAQLQTAIPPASKAVIDGWQTKTWREELGIRAPERDAWTL